MIFPNVRILSLTINLSNSYYALMMESINSYLDAIPGIKFDYSVRMMYNVLEVKNMERRQGKIIIHASGGTAANGANTYKLTLPSAWMKEMKINESDREVELSFNGNTITITRRLSVDAFIAVKREQGHALMKLLYFDRDELCTTIIADNTEHVLCIANHTDRVIKTAFGKNAVPTWGDLQNFLEERCIPRARAGLREYLEAIGVEEYDPIEIIKKTEGRMAEDEQWIRIEVLA